MNVYKKGSIMKKLLILLSACVISSHIHTATVRIKNVSPSQKAWFRINEAKGPISGFANFKFIAPNSSAFFNSDFDKIKMVTVLKIKGSKQVTMPKKKVISYITNNFYKPYNLIHARDGHMWIKPGNRQLHRSPQYGPPAIILSDSTSGKSVQQKIPLESGGSDVTLTVPIVEKKVYNLQNPIGALTVEARIEYDGKTVRRK